MAFPKPAAGRELKPEPRTAACASRGQVQVVPHLAFPNNYPKMGINARQSPRQTQVKPLAATCAGAS